MRVLSKPKKKLTTEDRSKIVQFATNSLWRTCQMLELLDRSPRKFFLNFLKDFESDWASWRLDKAYTGEKLAIKNLIQKETGRYGKRRRTKHEDDNAE